MLRPLPFIRNKLRKMYTAPMRTSIIILGLLVFITQSTSKFTVPELSTDYNLKAQKVLYPTFYCRFWEAVKMAHGADEVDASKLKGMSRIFNGQTMRGRANVAIATYASVGLLIAYFTMKPKSKK